MHYFVTGATGFIGRRLVRKLLERKGAVVSFLVRPESEAKVPQLREQWGVGPARAIAVHGDLTAGKLGVSAVRSPWTAMARAGPTPHCSRSCGTLASLSGRTRKETTAPLRSSSFLTSRLPMKPVAPVTK